MTYRFRIDTADGPAFVEIESDGWHDGGPARVLPAAPDDPTDVLPAYNVEHFLATAIGFRGHALNPVRPRPQDLYFALESNEPGVNAHRNPDILGYAILSGEVPADPAEDPNGDRGIESDIGRERGMVD